MPAQKKKPASRKPAPTESGVKKKPIRREIWAAVMFFLSVFTILGLFGVDALFINFFSDLMRRMLGGGFVLLPFALLAAGLELSLHRGLPVRLRVTATLLTPLVLGVLCHLAVMPKPEWGWGILKTFMDEGLNSRGGGLLGGLLADGFAAIFSKVGAVIVFVAALITLLLIAVRITPATIINYFRLRPYPAYTPKPERVTAPDPRAAIPAGEKQKRRPSIDIPIEYPVPAKADPLTSEQSELFAPKPDAVKTPAQALEPKQEPVKPPQIFAFNKPVKASDTTPATTLPADQPDPDETPELIDDVPVLIAPRNPNPVAEPVKIPVETVTMPEIPPETSAPEPQAQPSAVEDDIERIFREQEPRPYPYPPLSLLTSGRGGTAVDASEELKQNADRLMDTLVSFGLDAKITGVTRGPTVTRYELELEKGIKLSRLVGLSDDIALSLGASGVRIAPVPDKMSVVGIEVPNRLVSTVYIRDVIDSPAFTNQQSRLAFAVGRDISGAPVVGDISKLTHLLIAGTTGSGKSVCTNSLIISLLYKASPEEVRLIMIDPKMVELGVYNGVPHLLIPVVTDPKKASSALQWAVVEMERRYRQFMERGVRDIFGFNELNKSDPTLEKMPQIVIVIDELADLMLVAAKEVEESIVRIAQKARAAGMHLVVATQRPSADVITGLMKANIPSRIAFAVSSAMESRIILDGSGAEKLVGRGDMLYQPIGAQKQTRVQGCLITSKEVEEVVSSIKQGTQADYSAEVITQIERAAELAQTGKKGAAQASVSTPDDSTDDGADALLPAAIEIVLETGQASASMLQRRLKLGYSRAARIVDQMEERGVIGPYDGSKPRAVLMTRQEYEENGL